MQLTATITRVAANTYTVTDLNSNDGDEREVVCDVFEPPTATQEDCIPFCAAILDVDSSDIAQVSYESTSPGEPIRRFFVYTNPKEGQPCSSSPAPKTSQSSSVDTTEPPPSK